MKIDIRKELESIKMIQYGNFIGKNTNRHMKTFIEKDFLMSNPILLDKISYNLAKLAYLNCKEIQTVVGTITGGAFLGQNIARHLSDLYKRDVRSVFLEKEGNLLSIRDVFITHIKDKNILLVDDIVRTGSSFNKMIYTINKEQGRIIMCLCILDRSLGMGNLIELNVIKKSLIHFHENKDNELLIEINKEAELDEDKIVLGLIGRVGAGKTEFFNIIKDRVDNVEVFSTGRILKEITIELGIEESRANMVHLSKIIREKFGDNTLSNILKNQINNSKSRFIIIDGIRGESVLKMIKGFYKHEFICIESSLQDRYHRTIQRNEKAGESLLSEDDFIKQDNAGFQKNIDYLKSFSSWEILNNDDWEDYKNKVEELFDKIVKKYENRS